MNLKHQNQQTTQRQATTQLSTRAPAAKGSYVYHRPDDLFGPAVTYSWFKSRTTTVPERVTESFEELMWRCATLKVSAKNNGPTFSPFTFSSCSNGEYFAKECSFLAFQFEKLAGGIGSGEISDYVDDLASFVYRTRARVVSPQPAASYQLIVALRTPVPEEHYKMVAMNFAMRFSQLRGIINTCMSPYQRISFPSCAASRAGDFDFDPQPGRAYDWLPDFLEHQTPKSKSSESGVCIDVGAPRRRLSVRP